MENAMKAIQYQAYGGYQENRLVEIERPPLNDGEVLVEMRAVGINALDHTFRSGHIYISTPENLPRIGGQTGVGVVAETRSAGSNPAIASSSGRRGQVSWPTAPGAST